ncbi:hypothetical protein [Bacillus sp. NPDC077027]|uniref:hypothetical protein n=1 Tax=Bacillus sp. NPDC077027 TaxID=3390548 RepID=UPI003D047C68
MDEKLTQLLNELKDELQMTEQQNRDRYKWSASTLLGLIALLIDKGVITPEEMEFYKEKAEIQTFQQKD